MKDAVALVNDAIRPRSPTSCYGPGAPLHVPIIAGQNVAALARRNVMRKQTVK